MAISSIEPIFAFIDRRHSRSMLAVICMISGNLINALYRAASTRHQLHSESGTIRTALLLVISLVQQVLGGSQS